MLNADYAMGPCSCAAISNLGSLCLRNGDCEAARPLMEEAFAVERRLLGEDHPNTQISAANLALLATREQTMHTNDGGSVEWEWHLIAGRMLSSCFRRMSSQLFGSQWAGKKALPVPAIAPPGFVVSCRVDRYCRRLPVTIVRWCCRCRRSRSRYGQLPI